MQKRTFAAFLSLCNQMSVLLIRGMCQEIIYNKIDSNVNILIAQM